MNHNEARQELFRFQYNGQFQQCNDYPVGVSSGGPFYPVEPETPTSFGGIDFNCMDFALRVEKNYHQIRDVVCKAEIVDGKLKYSAAELNQKVNSLVTSEIPTLKVDLSQNYFSKSSIKAFEDLLCDFPLLYLDLSVNNLAFNDFSTSTNAVLRYFVAFKWCLYYDLYLYIIYF